MKTHEYSPAENLTGKTIIEKLDRDGKNRLDLSRLNLGPDLKELELDIDEALAKFYRSRKKIPLRSEPEENLVANCNQAVHDFGLVLAEEDKDDPSFFTDHPQARYGDTRSEGPLKGKFAVFDYHSVGLLTLPLSKKREIYIALDLTYDAVSGGPTRTLAFLGQSEAEIMNALKNHYGGEWKKIYRLDPNRKIYKSLD